MDSDPLECEVTWAIHALHLHNAEVHSGPCSIQASLSFTGMGRDHYGLVCLKCTVYKMVHSDIF